MRERIREIEKLNIQLNLIENILLPENCTFDEERRRFIFCNESRDLVACAGSGKTTALLAKILILEKQLPFENDRGICVLTHTNVAIDIIKEKVGKNSAIFKNPNCFFGTIQQFVNKFLAIPEYKKQYNNQPIIDNYFYNAEWDKKYRSLNRKAQQFCRINSNSGYPQSIRMNYKTDELSNGLLGSKINIDTVRNITADEKEAAMTSLISKRESIISSGFLTYDDAYYFAFKYINKYPYLANVISEKFKYLFIDEMQDTTTHQLEIIKKVFSGSNTIIQMIGDPNQAIYDTSKSSGDWTPKYPLFLSNSLRFSVAICNAISNIRCNPNVDIYGNNLITDIKPHIICYENNTSARVIEKFKQIISSNENALNLKINDKIKAIGWVGKPNETGRPNIQKYFSAYSKAIQSKKKYFKNLAMYLLLSRQNFFRTKNLKTYLDIILEIFSRFLYEQGVKIAEKKPTARRIFLELKDNDEFRESLLKFALKLIDKQDIDVTLKSYIRNDFFDLFCEGDISDRAENFLNNQEIEDFIEPEGDNSNIYCEVNGIPIEISTIHGVKGETHKATLYMETFYRAFDLEKIIPHLIDEAEGANNLRSEQRLRMAYVGMTRPSHLLCLAIRKNVLTNEIQGKLREKNWEIVDA